MNKELKTPKIQLWLFTGEEWIPCHYLTSKQVAKLCHVSNRTVEGWRIRKQGPDFIKLATGQILYPSNKVLDFVCAYKNGCEYEHI